MTKILLVDDSELVRSQLQQLLESNNYAVTMAGDGFEGLNELSKDSFDIILCDVNMPKMDGLTMLDSAIKDGKLEKSKVLMLTTETSKELKETGKALGVKGWISKPYKDDVLISVLEKLSNME